MGVTRSQLGLIDTFFLVAYSGGFAVLGSLIKQVSLKVYVVTGLIVSSVLYMSFALIYESFGYFSVVLMGVMMCLNGFAQATGWPGLMGLFGNWFENDKKGLLMAIWAMNANAGNILASTFCNLLQEHGADWTFNFFVTGAFALLVALLMIFFLREKPSPLESSKLE